MDADIWDSGVNNARSPGSPGELDFLRGFHDLTSLTQLRNWLQKNSGSSIRLTSVWQDKYGNVVPKSFPSGQRYNYQEVADLAVIVRDAQNNHASAWMWMLQAKVVKSSRSRLPPGHSTDREIFLYESMPDFTWHGKQSQGFLFQLRKDFGGTAANYKHWSFLCFGESSQLPSSNKFIDVRWPGSASSGPTVTSFCDELLELITHFSAQPVSKNVYGAPLTGNPEWEKLAKQILHKAQLKSQVGHASRVMGKKADVLVCAMMAELAARVPIWIDAQGQICRACCGVCFPGTRPEDILYSSISTGFDRVHPQFELSRAMREKWNEMEGESRNGNGDGGGEPPMGDDQRDDEDGRAGAKLTLFVDVAAG